MRAIATTAGMITALLVLLAYGAPSWAALGTAMLYAGIISLIWEVYEVRKAILKPHEEKNDGVRNP